MGLLAWTTIGVILTIAIFSFLIKDNPLYKFAEHLFVGVSVGYLLVVTFTQLFIPRVYQPTKNAFNSGDVFMSIWMIVGIIIGILFLTRLTEKHNWLSRYPISITVGFYSGFAIMPSLYTRVLRQLGATVSEDGVSMINFQKIGLFFKNPSWANLYEATYGPLIVIGVLTVLIYFFFSFKNTNPVIKYTRKPAMVYMMVGFGAAFGYTFMARISLYVDRMNFIINEWWPLVRVNLF
ncbi:MAG TPA: hypothetical protein VKN74_04455 [Candidatus Mcinerneyibacterium sp.]|nr:hypothetical protein [Candidatus Mcinerneyibacterium sp.]